MQIRKFRNSDAVELARMHRGTIRVINKKDYTKQQIKVWATASAKRWRDNAKAKNSAIFVALNKNKLIGFIQLKGSEVKALYVHKNYIGREVGKRLLKKLEETAYKKSIRKLICLSTITAKDFYNKHGYKTIKKTKYKIGNQKLTVYKMEKNLSH